MKFRVMQQPSYVFENISITPSRNLVTNRKDSISSATLHPQHKAIINLLLLFIFFFILNGHKQRPWYLCYFMIVLVT